MMGKPVEVGVVCGESALLWLAKPPPARGPRKVDTVERPASRLMRSARSASRLLVERLCWWPRWPKCGPWPRWPSLMAVVDSADSEVVVLVGVPLFGQPDAG